MVFRPLLLRTQDQKVHDDEDQDERQQLHKHIVAAERGRLSKSRRDEHARVSFVLDAPQFRLPAH
jgi:hypothetical protein